MQHSTKRILLGISLGIITLFLASCSKKFFDTVPDDVITIDKVFGSRAQTESWLGGMYGSIPDIWDVQGSFQYPITCDELDCSQWTNPGANTGSYSDGNISYYEQIRLATIFLLRIAANKEIQELSNGPALIQQYKGEARFLRAYYYWLMMKDMGPVVIAPPYRVAQPNDTYQIPRSSWDECVKFVISQMDSAKADVQEKDYIIGTNTIDPTRTGRIDKIIVSAVESQILLYHASPLFNGNTDLASFKNLDGKQLFNQTYDASRWQQAADASKAAIDIAEANGKSLYKVSDPNPFKAAFLSCRNLFWDGTKTEGIWLRPAGGQLQNSWEIDEAPRSIQGGGYNGMGVLQVLVDDFRMADGSDRTSNSSYNETTYATTPTDYYVTGTNTMYTNREPRFYADITFNGSVNPGIAAANSGSTDNSRVEFFQTGSSGVAGNARNSPKTGYLTRKNIHPSFYAGGSFTYRPTMIIRLAELYLNYAEALNESPSGDRTAMLTYLNRVRTRAGLPAIADLGQAEMRRQIRLERRIELCYESGNRYYDVRRWKIPDQAGSNQGGNFYGMNVNAGTSLSDPAFHTRTIDVIRAPWQPRLYFRPYPQSEIDRNKQLVQYPGY